MNEFVSKFTKTEINHIKLNKKYYQLSEELHSFINEVPRETFHVGVYLGEEKSKQFYPSLALLEILAQLSTKKVYVNSKSEWMFLCKRDIFGEGITKSEFSRKGKLVLVQNEKDENLGYGKIVENLDKKNKVVIKNLLDRGNFLRREK